MGELVWTERARQDLKEIIEYISRDSKAYAQSFALRLRRKMDRLSEFPESGAVVREDPDGMIRHIIVGNYRILYRPSSAHVHVLTVVHGARRLDLPK